LAAVARAWDSEGVPLLDEIVVDSYQFGSQKNAVVVPFEGDKEGWFSVIWETSKQASGVSSGVYFQIFNAAAAPLFDGQDTQVQQNDDGAQGVPRTDRIGENDFVVVWQSDDIDSNGTGISSRIFESSGSAATLETGVTQSVAGDQEDPDVAAIQKRVFVVVWTNANNGHVMGRVFNY